MPRNRRVRRGAFCPQRVTLGRTLQYVTEQYVTEWELGPAEPTISRLHPLTNADRLAAVF